MRFFAQLKDYIYNSIMKMKGESSMRKQKYYVYLSEQETRVLLKSLIRLKNALTQEGRYTDFVDNLILKIVAAPIKRI